MKKLAAAFFVLLSFSLSAQTLFQYGNDSVSVKDFLKAWHKNNTGAKTEKAFRDYLNLFITSRLKIKEAKERGYDTLPQLVSDLDNLRQQIMPAYLNDKEATNKLVNEAFSRSQKDIHIEHIFISFSKNGMTDSAAALKKLNEVQNKLKANVNFEEVAREYSDDPSAKANSGDLGWITVFTLPYVLENLAYETPVGKISPVYKSKAGYHIFINAGERKDLGRIKALQILLAFPPDGNEDLKTKMKNLADSIYNRLQKGDDFAKLAAKFSNDVISAAANGQMQEFGVGQYDPLFEKNVFTLKDGEISKPFLTTHGYHIVKRISKTQPANNSEAKAIQTLREKVEQSDRMATTKNVLANKIVSHTSFKKSNFRNEELWAYSDSVLNYRATGATVHLTPASTLFQLGDKNFTVADWIGYTQNFRYKSDGSGIKPYPQLWNEFVNAMALNYYQSHLEDFNPDFHQQITEFKEGNLFFEIMQREVWGPAQTDSIALVNYFNKNRSKYNWKQSADAVVFYANDAATAKMYIAQLKKSPASWRSLVNNFSEKIAADSARFELTQIPNPAKQILKAGVITNSLINKSDNTASFAYIIRIHDKTESRNFSEARGLVINDYQADLEKNWVANLEKKYPVRINQKVVEDLVKSKKY